MMDIKLIASDMDDTLLNSNVTISERNAKAIKSALAAGKIFLIATGRMYVSARPYAQKLGLDVPLVRKRRHNQPCLQRVTAQSQRLTPCCCFKLLAHNNVHQLQAKEHKEAFNKAACNQTAQSYDLQHVRNIFNNKKQHTSCQPQGGKIVHFFLQNNHHAIL